MHFHLEISHVSYQIIWNVEHLENKHSVLTYTLNPWYCSRRHTATSGVGQKIKTFLSEINHVEDQNGVYSTLKVQMS